MTSFLNGARMKFHRFFSEAFLVLQLNRLLQKPSKWSAKQDECNFSCSLLYRLFTDFLTTFLNSRL